MARCSARLFGPNSVSLEAMKGYEVYRTLNARLNWEAAREIDDSIMGEIGDTW